MSLPPTKRREGPFECTRCDRPPPEDLIAGISQFNAGLFFEQHEKLESLWREEADDIRYFYQAILLIGVGCHHLLNGNYHGATSKLAAGIALLRWFPSVCQHVDVSLLIADATRLLMEIQEKGHENMAGVDSGLIPRVRLVG